MADISQIKLPDNTTYDLKDNNAYHPSDTAQSAYTDMNEGDYVPTYTTGSAKKKFTLKNLYDWIFSKLPTISKDTKGLAPKGAAVSTQSQSTKFLREDGSWAAPSYTSQYSLPLAANGTRGGVQIGYTQSGKNYPVALSGEKMYVNVPWTDTNNRKSFFGTCDTASDVAAKVVTLSDATGWELKEGTIVGVKFDNTSTASNVTLNINNTGAKSIYYSTGVYTGNSSAVCGYADRVIYYMYDGTYWSWIHNGTLASNNAVTQTATTTNNNYEVLFSVTADNTTRTEGARKNSNMTFNPSTGNLQITQLNGVTVGSSPKFTDENTTYTLGTNGNKVKLTPSSGTAQEITVPYATSAGSATDDTKLPLTGGTMSGHIIFPRTKGIRSTDQTGEEYGLISDNGNNLWIGAASSAYRHHSGTSGNTYISSGYNTTNNAGNSTIYVSIPSLTVDDQGNETWSHATGAVLHSRNTSYTQSLSSGTAIGKIKINDTETTIYAPTNTNTTYTLGTNGDNVTLTPSSGTAQSITVPYATSAGSATDSTKLPLAGGTMTGDIKFPNNKGIYALDTNSTEFRLIGNGTNLWVGAKDSSSVAHAGATYISTGYNYTSSKGNATIYAAIPTLTDSTWSNSLVPMLHRDNYNDYITLLRGQNTTSGTTDLTSQQPGNYNLNWKNKVNGTSTTGMFPATNNANGILQLNRHDGNYNSYLGFSSNGALYYRSFQNVAVNSTKQWTMIPQSYTYRIDTSNSKYIQINIDGTNKPMVSFVVTIFQTFKARRFLISGYMNGSSHWSNQSAVLLGSSVQEDFNVIFGYDSDTSFWVGFVGGNYIGMTIDSITNGYKPIKDWSDFMSISLVDNFSGTTQSTITCWSPTNYEANLKWGGKNFSGGYGCIDAAMVSELGANRFMFAKAEGLTIEYSRDTGTTWTDYGATNTQKVGLFSSGQDFIIGKADSTNKATANTNKYQLRVTMDTSSSGCNVYTALNKFVFWISTNGSSSCTITIQKALQSTPTTFVDVATDIPVSGWSGYNVINVDEFTTYGNNTATQYGRIRFIFKANGGNTSYIGFKVNKIMAFGGVGWNTSSTMAKTGHLYSFDANQNATFPANLKATYVGASNGDQGSHATYGITDSSYLLYANSDGWFRKATVAKVKNMFEWQMDGYYDSTYIDSPIFLPSGWEQIKIALVCIDTVNNSSRIITGFADFESLSHSGASVGTTCYVNFGFPGDCTASFTLDNTYLTCKGVNIGSSSSSNFYFIVYYKKL